MTALKLDLEWRTTLATVLLFPGLIALGFWQLDRAQEKSELALSESQRATAAAIDVVSLLEMPTQERAYRAVTVNGEYVPDAVILLDNQIRDGRYGHDVYGIFYDRDSGQHILLNRGWVPGDASRRSVPQVEVPRGEFALSTSAYVPPGEPYILAEDQFTSLEWPLLVQTVSSPALRKILRDDLSGSLVATELRLLAQEPTGFRRDWPVVNVSPEKHQGYAVQWFTMAAALLVFFVIRSSNILSLGRVGGPPKKSSDSSSDTGSAKENTADHKE